METSGKDTTDEVICHYCYEQWDHMMYTQVTSRSDGNRRKRKWSASVQCVYVFVHARVRLCVHVCACRYECVHTSMRTRVPVYVHTCVCMIFLIHH